MLDLSGAVGTAARRAPSIISVRAEIKGKAAHAGFEPENGIHAIFAAAAEDHVYTPNCKKVSINM